MSDVRTATPHRLQTIGWIVVAALAAVGLAHLFAMLDAVRDAETGETGETRRIVATETNIGLSVFSTVDTVSTILNTARLLVLVVFITWLYLARDNFDRRADDNVNWRKGWTIGGWFIPLANLVIPNLVVGEIYARSSPDRTWTSPRLVNAWWIALLVSLFTYTETTTRAGGATEVHTPVFVAAVSGGAGVLAAVLAAVLVRRVSTWQDTKPAG
ncbi:DUF4328 domain-containing protein [Dactylosporangium roseum]|uniref:DUF4328 domain-containing protein n=1 Tax=Dactylosporangium roseum TaxID=47989 RepID=A0ABY5YWR8_9ACTN|nr:DUF4328 domain-containing protein [Dactylosporangium roseum]UWZ34190.1 DUF4328 domain-containing protein [Dactylosporangium roseum]